MVVVEAEAGQQAWFEFGRQLLIDVAARAEHSGQNETESLDTGVVGAARTRFHRSLSESGAFATIAANAGLAPADAEILALLATAESNLACGRLVAALHGDARRARLTLGLLRDVFGPNHSGPLAVAPEAPMCRSALVDVEATGPWADHGVHLHPGVVWALLGDGAPDPELPDDTEDHVTSIRHADGADSDTVSLPSESVHDLVVVNGPDRMRRRQHGTTAAFGDRFLCAAIADDTTPAHWASLVREATVTGRGIVVDVDGTLPRIGARWIERSRHLSWVISSANGPPVGELPRRKWMSVEADARAPSDAEWATALGPDVERTHRLTFDQLHRVARSREASGGDLDSAVRRLASGKLEQLTRRIKPTRGWDDIVLSPDRLAALHGIVDRYRLANRIYDEWGFSASPSRGLVALFSGPSGTGKTLASEIIAGALGLDVFKLDLSSVVSKYIGETEKNLEQIFDAASAANMVLFFDEADSLFGKRSEVKDARDRYANIEVSYLLQRLESYDGLVVMATNFEKNVDEAFLRRIHARVAFALPGVDERRSIWEHNIPPNAPTDGLDLQWIAERFELSGGTIRNAAVQAAFSAAAIAEPITMRAMVAGVAGELRKMGRLLRAEDFGEYFSAIDP